MLAYTFYEYCQCLCEGKVQFQGKPFLINPSAQELDRFVRSIHPTYTNTADFAVRGLIGGGTAYWFNAYDFTHASAAQLLRLDYRQCERMTAYHDRYGNIIVDASYKAMETPMMQKLGLDDEGVLPVGAAAGVGL